MAVSLGAGMAPAVAVAQFFSREISIELSPAEFDTLDGAEQKHLDRSEVLFSTGQWEEGIQTLRRIVDESGDKLIEMPDIAGADREVRRFLTLRSFVQWRISSLPDPALAIYRRQVDSQAEQALKAALAAHDISALRRVAEDYFCSSWGDDALLAQGDAALHNGDFGAARAAWQRILPLPPRMLALRSELIDKHFFEVPELAFRKLRDAEDLPVARAATLDAWYQLIGNREGADAQFAVRRLKLGPPLEVQVELARFWKRQGVIADLNFPDTEIEEAKINARLVLASILERDFARATEELEYFRLGFPQAEGRLAGREGNLAEALAALLAESGDWSVAKTPAAWSTFGGDAGRGKIVEGEVDIRAPLWDRELAGIHVPLPHQNDPLRKKRPGESDGRVLSYHPVIWRDALLICDQFKIYAFRLSDGEPYWPGGEQRSPGEIYADSGSQRKVSRGCFGAPRFTLTVNGDRLFARMGPPITDRLREGQERIGFKEEQGYLACLDLSRGGRLMWRIDPDAADWAFEGTPITDGDRLWVGMRRGNLRPEANVACFDVETQQMLWRTPVCSANSLGRFLNSVRSEITSNLLTLDQGTLYYNTNLGCVAGLNADTGRIQWATAYEREPHGRELEKRTDLVHVYRDLNPCLVSGGRVFFAPADNTRIFALDAANGMLHWKSVHDSPEDAAGLLGVAGGNVIACGDRVWWFRADGGRFVNRWPESETIDPVGLGRGALVGNAIYWPTRGAIHVLGQATAAPLRQPIDLRQRGVVAGGNLLVSGEYVVLVSPDLSPRVFRDHVYVFRRGSSRDTAGPAVTATSHHETVFHPQTESDGR
ncbi:MAG: PQQ-binding-like beta-propeller repeat protein [Pirellulales bacterium]|nr:PQQ-binding-like beta-propeller repeat protein [Pirellulales bacterium]